MKKLMIAALAAFALCATARPAFAGEEKDPNKLMKMMTDKLGEFTSLGANYKENKQFQTGIKYLCQKGNMFGGVFGVCRSAEGVVCGAKKEAFVACSIVCGELAKGMKESEGFAESKCVTKHGAKWGFSNHGDAVTFAKAEIKAKAAAVPMLQKLCPVLKKIEAQLPADLKEFAAACK